MVHFEFGRGGLAQAHLLKAFELLQGAIKGAFVLFSRTLLGLVGFVLQNHFLARGAGVVKTTPAAMRPRPFRERLLRPPKRWRRLKRSSHPVSRAPPRWLPWMALPRPLNWQSLPELSVRPELPRVP